MKSTANLRSAQFEVSVAPDRLDRSDGGPIAGQLAVRLGNAWFPERTWSDFPVIVLGWWLRECATLRTSETGCFRFMDGPCQFNARKREAGRVELEWEDRNTSRPAPVLDVVVPMEHIRVAVRQAALEILAGCDRRKWKGRDVEELWSLAEAEE